MPSVEGKVVVASGGAQRTVYFSKVFAVWEDTDGLHVTLESYSRDVSFLIKSKDGAVYHAFKALYQSGLDQKV